MSAAEVNFCFPVKDLESDRVKLTPFIYAKHADAFLALEPPTYEHLPYGPFPSNESFKTFYENDVQPNPGFVFFAVYDKTQSAETGHPDGALAGIMGYANTSPAHLVTEIAWVLTSPQFQKTHVTSHAIGLLLHYALDLPSDGGLGLRRVEWRTSELNEGSLRAAERMGMKRDGSFRWTMVLRPDAGKAGNGQSRREGDPRKEDLGRNTISLGLCWDEWEDSVRDRVDSVMARTK